MQYFKAVSKKDKVRKMALHINGRKVRKMALHINGRHLKITNKDKEKIIFNF